MGQTDTVASTPPDDPYYLPASDPSGGAAGGGGGGGALASHARAASRRPLRGLFACGTSTRGSNMQQTRSRDGCIPRQDLPKSAWRVPGPGFPSACCLSSTVQTQPGARTAPDTEGHAERAVRVSSGVKPVLELTRL